MLKKYLRQRRRRKEFKQMMQMITLPGTTTGKTEIQVIGKEMS